MNVLNKCSFFAERISLSSVTKIETYLLEGKNTNCESQITFFLCVFEMNDIEFSERISKT